MTVRELLIEDLTDDPPFVVRPDNDNMIRVMAPFFRVRGRLLNRNWSLVGDGFVLEKRMDSQLARVHLRGVSSFWGDDESTSIEPVE